MSVANVTAVVSAAVAVLGLALAAYQTLAARRTRKTADVLIAQLKGVIASALAQVRAAADSADSIVQRSKSDASADELQNLARVTRAQLTGLSAQLSRGAGTRDRWKAGSGRLSADPQRGSATRGAVHPPEP